MAYDVDFVTVATTYLHAREDFEKFHVRLLSGRFNDSTITPIDITDRFLRPDFGVVHWSWKIEGDKNPDGTARQPRYGMMVLVAESGTALGKLSSLRIPTPFSAYRQNLRALRLRSRFQELRRARKPGVRERPLLGEDSAALCVRSWAESCLSVADRAGFRML
jgi:hypothetical protein